MSQELNLPEGVPIPGWFRRFLEARATQPGPTIPPPPAEGNHPAAAAPFPPPPPRGNTFAKICKDFKAMGGKDFHGTESFVAARNWLKETEDLFIIFEVEDRQKVQLAVWLLKGEASYWWEVTNAERPVETWEDFRARFETKFLSDAERSLQLEKFLFLKQGDKTVREYVNQFDELARFGLDLVNTPHKKALRFVKGLNEPLHSLAMTHIPMGATYERLVQMALLNEEDKGKKETKAESSQGKKEGLQPKKTDFKKGGKGNKEKRKCNFCGKVGHLVKDCRKKKAKENGGCFSCGETGHRAKDCPKKRGQGQRAGSTPGAQVHVLEAPPLQQRGINTSVESVVYLYDHPVRTLFDSGASHSFISSALVESLHLKTSMVEDPLIVSNPIGGPAHLSMICLGLKISILSVEFQCSAFVLGFSGYGLILGMDWLSSNGAILDCEKRVVRLLTQLGNTLEISCNPSYAVMLSYLESLDASVENLQSVRVVREYPDVFEEVKGLPPKREIDFRIYLVDNAKPVALPVRHMAPR